jgi:uncharacterized small protein (DUF1192 family)
LERVWLTYHKFPGEAWPDDEFQVRNVQPASSEIVEMALAERGTFVGKKAELQEEITHLQAELESLKAKRKAIERQITVSQLPE